MQRSIVSGVISERDRLLNYSVGEYFQEMSLFIQEIDQKNKETDKILNKNKV